ncbi:tetratricopeptide repeat protein [Erythrobacter sp.]|uniref:tetratricopeptide repeat protein n=1 Tax=Erythrobacter sp. TaxID=1042 RepID=UPI001425BD5E|nr:tetratricopeptide repeat protein [Erythrobacter sp.]QIQ87859.1 MAG: sel1 repeat family protein [Erythrobacter sp.]
MSRAAMRLAALALAILAAPLCAQTSGETYERALDAERNGDYAAARRLHQQACDAEDARACRELVVMHLKGRGGPQSDSAARSTATRACRLGSVDGCGILMQLAHNAKGGPADFALVRRLGKTVCKSGEDSNPISARACFHFGRALLTGKGGPTDLAGAEGALTLACRGSAPQGCTQLAALHLGRHGGPRNDARAARFFLHACIRGEKDVCDIYDSDPVSMRKRASEACEAGDKGACLVLERP